MTVSGLTLSGAQAADYTLTQPTTTANITPASLSVSGITAVDKVYDASTDGHAQLVLGAIAVGRIQRRHGRPRCAPAPPGRLPRRTWERDHGNGDRSDDQRGPGQRLHADPADDDGQHHSGRGHGFGSHGRRQGVRRHDRRHPHHVGRGARGRVSAATRSTLAPAAPPGRLPRRTSGPGSR